MKSAEASMVVDARGAHVLLAPPTALERCAITVAVVACCANDFFTGPTHDCSSADFTKQRVALCAVEKVAAI